MLLLKSLLRLQAEWEKLYGKRAGGGAIALGGYHYQFLVTLLKTLRKWKDDETADYSGPRVFGEFLSDIVQATSSGIIVTQVKKTLRSATEALQDLWRIYEIALSGPSDLISSGKLTFQITSSQSILKDIPKAVDNWQPHGGGEEKKVSEFKRRVKFETLSDPTDELLALLANELRAEDPLGMVYSWLGFLQSAIAKESPDYVGAGEAIWNDICKLRHASIPKNPPGITLWTDSDRPPVTVLPGGVLTGQRMQIHNLRNGFFAPRPIFDEVEQACMEWLARLDDEPQQTVKVPVFWIGGRSGTGKSVALLHLLSRLHEGGQSVVLWLSDQVRILPEAIRWSHKVQRKDKPLFIGIDDPYKPADRYDAMDIWKDAVGQLQSRREAGEEMSSLPCIVCCGPTEQAERLSEELFADVHVRLFELSHEKNMDLAALRQWYVERTGKQPPDIGDDNVLLVQLFFEWQTGLPLKEFADRFRARVSAEDDNALLLESSLARMLAVNRLYADYPYKSILELLPPTQQGQLDVLLKDNHLSIDKHEKAVRLAHPHLSNAIYEAWFPNTSRHRPERIRHLVDAIDDSRRWGESPQEKTAPLWALAAPSHTKYTFDLEGRVPMEVRLPAIEETYKAQIGADSQFPALFELPVWIQLRAEYSDLHIQTDPVDIALSKLTSENITETGLRLTCHKLLQYLDRFDVGRQERLVAALCALLETQPDWHEWPPILQDAVGRTQSFGLWGKVLCWLRGQGPRDTRTATLLLKMIEIDPTCPILRDTVAGLLWTAPGEGVWSRIVERTLQQCMEGNVPDEVNSWVARNHHQMGACWVLRDMLNRGFPPAKAWAEAWASQWHGEPSANFVLERLWEWGDPHLSLRQWSQAWLRQGYRNSERIVESLVKAFPNDEEIRGIGYSWLATEDVSHFSWTRILSALRDAGFSHPRLTSVALKWLASTPITHPSWPYHFLDIRGGATAKKEKSLSAEDVDASIIDAIWEDHSGMVEAATEKANFTDVDRKAMEWLQANIGHDRSAHVWHLLITGGASRAELLSLAGEWLTLTPISDPTWPSFFGRALQKGADISDLCGKALRWLENAPLDHPRWTFVWQPLWDKGVSRDNLLTLAISWLTATPTTHSSWPYLFLDLRGGATAKKETSLSDEDADAPIPDAIEEDLSGMAEESTAEADFTDLDKVAMEWLQANIGHNRSAQVWHVLWSRGASRADLLRLATDWLALMPTSHPSWPSFFGRALQNGVDLSDLYGKALRWLESAPLDYTRWTFVWQPLWDKDFSRDNLLRLAFSWLKATATTHPSWPYIFSDARSQQGDFSGIDLKAIEWLENASLDDEEWTYMWQALYKAEVAITKMCELALKWLKHVSPSNSSWPNIYTHSTKHLSEGIDDLDGSALACLMQLDPGHDQWGFIWSRLWSKGQQYRILVPMGLGWLGSTALSNRGWTFVWEALWKCTEPQYLLARSMDEPLEPLFPEWDEFRRRLVEHGTAWCTQEDRFDSKPWGPMFGGMWKANLNREQLALIGLRWLQAEPVDEASDSWPYMWNRLAKLPPPDFSALDEKALTWLTGSEPNHSQRTWVWSNLWEREVNREQLASIGVRWLHVEPVTHNSWPHMWNRLAKFPPPDFSALDEKALTWLTGAEPNHSQWTWVWSNLRERDVQKQGLDLAALDNKAFTWLRSAKGDKLLWSLTWSVLWRRNVQNDALADLGSAWLREQSHSQRGWSHVWALLANDSPESVADLDGKGKEWLKSARLDHSRWTWAWLRLHDLNVERESIEELGYAWLLEQSYEEKDWAHIWNRVAQIAPNDFSALNSKALAWLADAERSHPQWMLTWRRLWAFGFESQILAKLRTEDFAASEQGA